MDVVKSQPGWFVFKGKNCWQLGVCCCEDSGQVATEPGTLLIFNKQSLRGNTVTYA